MAIHLKRLFTGLTLTTLFFFASMAQAAFVGDYAVENWTTTQSGPVNGTVGTAFAPDWILITEPDNGTEIDGGASEVTFTIAAAADGIFSFDWLFDIAPDPCCSAVTVYNNGRSILLHEDDFPPVPPGSTAESILVAGSYSMSVLAGDIIGFGVWSENSCCGGNELWITNFSAPSAAPIPAAIWLFGTALIGFIAVSRRRIIA